MRSSISTSDAPAALGPYSQAIKHDGVLWCSGQLGLDPAKGTLVSEDTAGQTEQALRNLEAVCREAGTSLSKALKLTIYLIDLADFQAMNTVLASFFEVPYPARATVQVVALPKAGRVEIDAMVAL
jgi:2-iminobutanoate/2-iminopropanoate deaminase